jgi:hypothetical protein
MNQPAFPLAVEGEIMSMGMSMRDYFAAQAMQGAIAHGLFNADKGNKDYAEYVSMLAYIYADAMLKAR